MPTGICTWCARSRVVELQAWRSPRTGEQLVGEVCRHCYFGAGGVDDCRTCRAKAARATRLGQTGVRALGTEEARTLFEMQSGRRPRRGKE